MRIAQSVGIRNRAAPSGLSNEPIAGVESSQTATRITRSPRGMSRPNVAKPFVESGKVMASVSCADPATTRSGPDNTSKTARAEANQRDSGSS
jgi:hypothetical protein